MEMRVLIFACLLQLKTALSTGCFECHSSNHRKCDGDMKARKCLGKQQRCYTLQYIDVFDDGSEEHGFKKDCVDEKRVKSCQSICQKYKQFGYKTCNVVCCEGDLCNKNGFRDLAEQSRKSKRSSIGNNNDGIKNSSAKYFNSKKNLYVNSFGLVVFILYHTLS